MRIGNKRTAKAIAQVLERQGYPYKCDADMVEMPDGLRVVGEGCNRIAVLHEASGVVYKIGDDFANESDMDSYRSKEIKNELARISEHIGQRVWIPVSRTLFMDDGGVVSCQQFVDGIPSECASYYGRRPCDCGRANCHQYVRDELIDVINDNHPWNILFVPADESYAIVDLEF